MASPCPVLVGSARNYAKRNSQMERIKEKLKQTHHVIPLSRKEVLKLREQLLTYRRLVIENGLKNDG